MNQLTICPTITAESSSSYTLQMNRVTPFAGRIHIDLADGLLAPRKLIDLDKLWWPGNITVDFHIMYQRPFELTDLILVEHPQLAIVQAEAEGDFQTFASKMHQHGIEVGVALLAKTGVSVIQPALDMIDHVLIFSGNLGYQGGGQLNEVLLQKARILRQLKPTLEIGWDGGVNDQNISHLKSGGLDVINVGSYIQTADDPQKAYTKLWSLIN